MTSEDLVANNAALSGEVQRAQESLKIALLTIDKLKVELAYLRRMKYGRSSEQLEHAQLELVGGMVVVPTPDPVSNVISIKAGRKTRQAKMRPGLRELPEHLPRRTVVHAPLSGSDGGCDCQACGRALREIGQDVSEVLDYEPGSFHVVRHVRPRLACTDCKTITQTAAPSRPVERGMAGAGLLAHVLVSKYADHLPLYRQCQIYAREGVMLERSTLADWVGQAARLLSPLAQAIGRHVLRGDKIHGDDTPIRVLGGKGSKAKTGRLWVYVRDDRPSAGTAPPAVWFQYSPNRKGEHPARHLKDWQGILQADAFAGYNQLYEDGRIVEAACWSHSRRKLWDIHERQHKLPGTLAHQGLERIAKIFKIEAEIRGKPALRRRRVRQVQTRPVLVELKTWMSETLAQVSAKSPMALAVGYSLSNWSALVRFAGDGRIEAENNAAERALRSVAIGRKNFLHLGSDAGGNSAAVIYTLIGTAKLNGINPQHYLRYVLERIADHKANRIDDLLPWVVADQMGQAQAAQSRELAQAA
ncbi:IS66 family transposase [Roseateles toxinivorans]|uniref:Transposase n=1 Tax=Roseateles toxinivorans TaxID=270368 RepID=A0A4R6QIZ2_9BURK|nr:IS66 family transposase [Roseateles toxinivorans]TDP62592.1 transposase [Roseateles toxinivorans]